MKQGATLAMAVVAMLAFTMSTAWAGSPHFVSCSVSESGNVLSADGKEAGLGAEEQITVVVTATALCINNGGNHPRAVNKESVSAESQVPVQNGKAIFSIDVTATFKPECSPPMTVDFTDISVCDTTNGICCTL